MNKDNMPEIRICRVCLNKVEFGGTFLFINDCAKTSHFEELLIKNMIEKCVSEIDLEVCDSPIICIKCYDLLLSSYIFKSKCFETEQRIYHYMETNGFQVGDKISLNNLIETKINNDVKDVVIKTETSYEGIVYLPDSSYKEDIDAPIEVVDKKPETEPRKLVKYPKRSYTCDTCEYKTYKYAYLKKHLNTCKGKQNIEMFKCNECTYSTSRKRNLKRHMMIHGGDRPYNCGICNKGFTEKFHLTSHMYKHTGNLPFKCEEEGCQSRFARKCDLNAHIVKHLKHQSYTCSSCKISFMSKTQWMEHKKEHKKKRSGKYMSTDSGSETTDIS